MPGGWTANYFVTVSTKALSLNGDALKSIVKRSAKFVEQKGCGVGMASCSRCFSRISFICNVCWCRLHPTCPMYMFSSPVVPPRESALSCAAWNLSRSKKIWKVSGSSQMSHWATMGCSLSEDPGTSSCEAHKETLTRSFFVRCAACLAYEQ